MRLIVNSTESIEMKLYNWFQFIWHMLYLFNVMTPNLKNTHVHKYFMKFLETVTFLKLNYN